MPTVLIIDADRDARMWATSAMRYGGLAAENAKGLRQASRLLRRNRYAALLVDPGFEPDPPRLIEELRAQTDAPIIAVSDRDDRPYKVALLDAGADDFVTRPIDPEELLARIRAVSRRVVQLDEHPPVVTPDFTIHLADRRLVSADGIDVTLSPTEWRLIEVLVHHMGHLVTREELLASVWGPDAMDKPGYLRVHMSSIRQKVEPDPSAPRYFVTVPRLGLRFDPAGEGTAWDTPQAEVPDQAPCQPA